MATKFSLTILAAALYLILIELSSNVANATLTVHPTDAVVLVNKSTYFNCSTSSKNMYANYVLWYHYPMNSVPRIDVYDEGTIMPDYAGRFRIETNMSAGVVNLVVIRPSPADAGRYECQDGFGQGDKASAELIILDKTPSCESNINQNGVIGANDCGLVPDEIQFSCNAATSHGNILPTLEWKLSGDESRSSLRVCERSSSCNLTLQGNLTFDSQSFVCQTTKGSTQQHGCFIGPIQVRYAVRTREKFAIFGDVMCYANASQPCSYMWYNAKDMQVSSNENLGYQDPGEYVCKAKCDMNQQAVPCRFTAMEVTIVPPEPVSGALVAALVASIVLLIIIGFFLYKYTDVFKCIKRSACKTSGEDKEIMSPNACDEVLNQWTEKEDNRLLKTSHCLLIKDKTTVLQTDGTSSINNRHKNHQPEQHQIRIQRNYDRLIKRLNVPDVVTRMFQQQKLTVKQHEHLRKFRDTPTTASEELLSIVMKSPSDVYECFLQSLQKTEQHELYQLLISDGNSGELYMSDHCLLIQKNYDWLILTLIPEVDLLANFYSGGVLNEREYSKLSTEKEQFEKNELLLRIISRKSADDFKKFIIALNDTQQQHVAARLTNLNDPDDVDGGAISHRREGQAKEAVSP